MTSIEKAQIMDADGIRRAVTRIAHEIVERNQGTEEVVLVGIRRRGLPLARRIAAAIEGFEGVQVPTGALDITLYRDDLQLLTVSRQPIVRPTELPFNIDGKVVVLVDDVLYTGRTVRAALDELPDPAWDLVEIERYRQAWATAHGRFNLNMVASRGCPYQCVWCAKTAGRSHYDARSPGRRG